MFVLNEVLNHVLRLLAIFTFRNEMVHYHIKFTLIPRFNIIGLSKKCQGQLMGDNICLAVLSQEYPKQQSLFAMT